MNYLVVLCSFGAFNLATAEEYVVTTTIKNNVSPDTCRFGYKRIKVKDTYSYLCEPMCEPPCEFGKCTEPAVCTCYPGFRNTTIKHVCEPIKPICKFDCLTSNCIEDDKCQCLKGFIEDRQDPSKCECSKNFKKIANGKMPSCIPICDPPCVNGECTEPGKCTCLPGFSNKTANVCTPLCKVKCVNSTCVRDGECKCDNGYTKDKLDPSKCKPSCLTCTQDECIEPNICRCPAGSIKFYVEPNTNYTKSWLNKTAIHLAFCVPPTSSNRSNTEPLAGLTAEVSPWFAIVLLLLSLLVIGILAITMAYYRNRWTAYRVNNSGSVKHVISGNDKGRIELECVSTDSSK